VAFVPWSQGQAHQRGTVPWSQGQVHQRGTEEVMCLVKSIQHSFHAGLAHIAIDILTVGRAIWNWPDKNDTYLTKSHIIIVLVGDGLWWNWPSTKLVRFKWIMYWLSKHGNGPKADRPSFTSLFGWKMFYIKPGNRTESEKKFEDWYLFVYINLYIVVNLFQHIDSKTHDHLWNFLILPAHYLILNEIWVFGFFPSKFYTK